MDWASNALFSFFLRPKKTPGQRAGRKQRHQSCVNERGWGQLQRRRQLAWNQSLIADESDFHGTGYSEKTCFLASVSK
jgi:hypothetical protein